MYLRVMGMDLALSTILIFYFGIIPAVWYFVVAFYHQTMALNIITIT